MLLGVGVVDMANTDHGFERRWLYYIRREVTISKEKGGDYTQGGGETACIGDAAACMGNLTASRVKRAACRGETEGRGCI